MHGVRRLLAFSILRLTFTSFYCNPIKNINSYCKNNFTQCDIYRCISIKYKDVTFQKDILDAKKFITITIFFWNIFSVRFSIYFISKLDDSIIFPFFQLFKHLHLSRVNKSVYLIHSVVFEL